MIRELPLLPKFWYRFTCRRCRCHNVAVIPISGGFSSKSLVVCGHCGWVFPQRSERVENERHHKRLERDGAEREIQDAIRRAASDG